MAENHNFNPTMSESEKSPSHSEPETDTERDAPQGSDPDLAARQRRAARRRTAVRDRQTADRGGVDPAIFDDNVGKEMTANKGQGQTVTPPQRGGQIGGKKEGGERKEPLRLRLDVNLDLDVELRARIHGDVTLALL